MNKCKKICRIGLFLTVLLAATISLTACTQNTNKDYFTEDEILGQSNFGSSSPNVYRYDRLLYETSAVTDVTTSCYVMVIDSYDNNLWKYIVHYQSSYFDVNGKQIDYRSREVYVKNKTDSLRVYNQIHNNFNQNLSSDFRYAGQYYGIDYDLEALMSDSPASLIVQNMKGKTFSRDERIFERERQYQDSDGNYHPYTQGIYETRKVTPYIKIEDGLYKKGYFWVMDNGVNKSWPYVVHYFQDFYTVDFDGNYQWKSESSAGVACMTKEDAKYVLQNMLNAYKASPTRFTDMPEGYRGWQALGIASDADYFNLDTLLSF